MRFGIPAERIEHKSGILSIVDRSKTGKPVKLVIRNESNTYKSVFPSLLYTPSHLFPDKPPPEEFRKVRITSEIGEFIFYPYSRDEQRASVNLSIEVDDKPRKLSELANLWRVVHILQTPAFSSCIIEIYDEEHPPVKIGKINTSKGFSKDHSFIAQAVDDAWHLSKLFDLPPNIELTLEQILYQSQVFAEVRRIYDFNCPIDAVRGQIIGNTFPLDKEYAALFSRQLKFDTIIVFVIVGLAGILTILADTGIEEKPFEIVKPRRIHSEFHILSSQDNVQLEKLLDFTLAKIEEKGYEVIKTYG